MSLFPAFSTATVADNIKDDSTPGPSWLENSSYQSSNKSEKYENFTSSTSGSDDDGRLKSSRVHNKRRKNNKSEKKKEKKCISAEMLYYEDSVPLKHTVPVPQIQLSKPVSNYSSNDPSTKKRKKHKNKKSKRDRNRYFLKSFGRENEEKMDIKNPDPIDIEEFLKQTENFNKSLRAEPSNVKMWLDYVKLQDSGEGSFRGRSEKKLSILDKALENNPDSEELLHEKMLISELIFPIEKVGIEAKNIVAKFPKNLTGWLWILNSSQYNLSKMTAPGVLLIYEQVLGGIHKSHHDSLPFLDFLLQCGHFLRQCGLWEQLWVLLELYLELSLTTAGSGAFKVSVSLPENEIKQLEDRVITSGLPLGALWLRVERLRECVFFSAVEESEDPQRVVFREDMTPLLFPITQVYNTQLIINTLLLLKVPPLPMTDAFFKYTRLHSIPWFLDSVEFVLAAKFSKGDSTFLDIVPELLLGPQYLSDTIGCPEFFNFVNNIFEKCILHCQKDQVCFLVWQMRWWRWIYSIRKMKNNENDTSKKLFLGLGKKLLKTNRDVIALYTEYALLENEVGDFDAAVKVLETAINLRDPPLLTGIVFKRDLCNLYRVYIELLIRRDKELFKEKILSTLISLAFGESIKNISVRDDLVKKCSDRFKHISAEVIRDLTDRPPTFVDVISSDFSVTWLVCHAWFLYITEGISESIEVFSKAMNELSCSDDTNGLTMSEIIQEGLHEGLLDIFTNYSLSNPGNNAKFFELAEKALKCYPNNAFFLNTVYSCELAGLKWPRFLLDVISLGTPLASALIYFMTHVRLTKDEALKATAGKRLYSLIEKLRDNFERCPLFWRLLLQASSLKNTEDIKRTFYQAVEKCPWVKVLYYEAAKILPEDLPEIQDLIVEKELRLHITPEELEILRQDT